MTVSRECGSQRACSGSLRDKTTTILTSASSVWFDLEHTPSARSAASLIKCHGPVFPPFFDPLEAPPIAPICNRPVIGSTYSTTTAPGLGGRQRAVRPVDLKYRSIRGEVVELTFTRAQRTL